MITEQQVEEWVWFLQNSTQEYAQAEAQFHGLERRLKSLEAQLKMESDEKSVAAQETWARASSRYTVFLEGIQAAEEKFRQLKADREAAEIGIETWRSLNANRRGNV